MAICEINAVLTRWSRCACLIYCIRFLCNCTWIMWSLELSVCVGMCIRKRRLRIYTIGWFWFCFCFFAIDSSTLNSNFKIFKNKWTNKKTNENILFSIGIKHLRKKKKKKDYHVLLILKASFCNTDVWEMLGDFMVKRNTWKGVCI